MLALFGGNPVRPEPYPAWPVFDETEVNAVADVVRTGEWGRLGSHRVIAFERAFAAYQGAAYGLAVNSGTSALEMGLEALRLPRGSEVILAPFTFMASATSILNAGLVPVFVDIDPDTYNLDPACLAAAITPRTSAIMAVHFGGLACDMQAILDIAAANGPARHRGRRALARRHLAPSGPGDHRRRGVLQLPGQQEPQLGRGRRGAHR